jgi:thioredoxin reductase (NADPH)
MTAIKGKDKLESIDIKSDDNEVETLQTDYVLGFFGLIMQLGPIANWGLNIDKKTVEVDTEKFETNQKGIYAVGDICTYPGKLKLILCGFHEATLMCQSAYKILNPGKNLILKYTTVSGVHGFDGSKKEAEKSVIKSINS